MRVPLGPRRKWQRLRRAKWVSVISVSALAALVAAALAYWTGLSTLFASATVGTLATPSITSATIGPESVTLVWTPISPPGGGTVTYYVSRDGLPPSGGCPNSGAPSTATSCLDAPVPTGSHSYTVTALWRSWTARSETKTVVVPSGIATHLVLEAASVGPTAGEADGLTVVAKDANNNTVTNYNGSHSLTFGGSAPAPNGAEPTVAGEGGIATAFGGATPINFLGGKAIVSGTANGIMRLYKAGEARITVSDGSINNGTGLPVTVKPGPFKSFGVTPAPAEPVAGQAFEAKLAAWDEFHNVLTGYTRTRKLIYSGAEAAPSGKAPEYATSTEPTFSAGEATLTGFHFYKAAATTLKVAEEGTGHEGSASFTVKAAAAKTLSLAAAATEVGSGTPDNLTITALDEFQNVATSYGGTAGETKSLTFEGAGASPNGSEATVANESGSAIKFGQPTAIRFVAGKASVTAQSNGVMTLYKVEEAHIKVKEGTLNNGAGLAIKVIAGPAKSFRLAAPAPAEPEAGQAFNVTITALDAGGNLATSFGGPGGQNKTLAYSGPLASPSGKAPEYPGSATTVNFREGVGTATAIKLYHSGSNTLTAKEGTIEGSVAFNVRAGAAKRLEWVEPKTAPTGKFTSENCLFECTAEEVGNEGQFIAKVGVGDEWGNLQTSHGTATISVELSATGPGGTFSPTALAIAAGASSSASFSFTSRARGRFRNNLRAQATGYTGASALVTN